MAEWKVVNVDKGIRTRETTGATYAMQVPGGMLIRVCSQLGESITYVPDPNHPSMSVITVDDLIEKWIDENKIT